MIDDSGRERHGISARYAADYISEKTYIGFGRNGIIEFLKPAGMGAAGPFASKWDIRQLMTEYPKKSLVHGNHRERGAKIWIQQPVRAKTGRSGSTTSIFIEKQIPMLNWLFKNRSAERKEMVRSAADAARDRQHIGLWNDPIPDYSRVAPNPMIRNRARYLAANSAGRVRGSNRISSRSSGSNCSMRSGGRNCRTFSTGRRWIYPPAR